MFAPGGFRRAARSRNFFAVDFMRTTHNGISFRERVQFRRVGVFDPGVLDLVEGFFAGRLQRLAGALFHAADRTERYRHPEQLEQQFLRLAPTEMGRRR